MNFHYPNGKKFIQKASPVNKKTGAKKASYSNRGMTLEEDINETNKYYLANGVAVIHKKPTPVQIVDVHYPQRSAAVIKEAYFKQPSTTDYNGLYKGRYIDFEAKETRNKTSFPLQNLHSHQIQHMKQVDEQDGIAFILIRFSTTEEIFFMKFIELYKYWQRMNQGGRKSIKKEEIEADGVKISLGFHPRIDYLKTVHSLYF
ncbi:Holliday junction resolvase RecU [Rossellomorea vietnamensis]|uniref:Holliday junction resolvase RecU n=1 Tax=Rossellomorea vietnamensis TaxID=218284 RepID=A0A5D4KHR5_9BACI|nr:Holliday junction resolvase RecU [Rossellomorea vietnamensis]TYR76496.1 Holliday junction resolvase RecU [Rossellomorea vietnamensis]